MQTTHRNRAEGGGDLFTTGRRAAVLCSPAISETISLRSAYTASPDPTYEITFLSCIYVTACVYSSRFDPLMYYLKAFVHDSETFECNDSDLTR
ncbi:hypothetical protein H5410_019366 [Solanum commersonii]|uniref:Uncharacterized protein n=1 Tax=Solanum commersonii TaxID=4109 RepID=A0A9J5Z772_SOLCO|nr:hypothetical protein H5410_019366 [Solanum commersonii]